jgi:DNA-binding PadR family transcriptional regulator
MDNLSLKLDLLEALDGIGAHGMPRKTARQQVQLTARPTPSATEVDHALAQLEAEKFVVSVRDEMAQNNADLVIFTITNSGKAQLRARGR